MDNKSFFLSGIHYIDSGHLSILDGLDWLIDNESFINNDERIDKMTSVLECAIDHFAAEEHLLEESTFKDLYLHIGNHGRLIYQLYMHKCSITDSHSPEFSLQFTRASYIQHFMAELEILKTLSSH